MTSAGPESCGASASWSKSLPQRAEGIGDFFERNLARIV
jgi:hypothetical protein